LEAWKKHSSTTGGYFQCNRYETVNKIIAKEKELVTAAEQRHLRMVELNKVNSNFSYEELMTFV
jgi:ankyrin repeat/IBR domain-containing protein 1